MNPDKCHFGKYNFCSWNVRCNKCHQSLTNAQFNAFDRREIWDFQKAENGCIVLFKRCFRKFEYLYQRYVIQLLIYILDFLHFLEIKMIIFLRTSGKCNPWFLLFVQKYAFNLLIRFNVRITDAWNNLTMNILKNFATHINKSTSIVRILP